MKTKVAAVFLSVVFLFHCVQCRPHQGEGQPSDDKEVEGLIQVWMNNDYFRQRIKKIQQRARMQQCINIFKSPLICSGSASFYVRIFQVKVKVQLL